MKSFVIVENTAEKGVCKEGNIDFVPAFPGIFIDLDKEVDGENCDHYLGTTGLGCEYHLKDGQIKKMFLELLPFDLVEFVPESVVEVIKKQLEKEIVPHEVVFFQNAKSFSPQKILLNEDFNLVQFFFSRPQIGESLQASIESLNYLKVSSNVAFGLTEKNELASIIVKDFAKRIYENDFILESTIDGNSERFKKFVKLNQQFYDKNIDGKDFEVLVKNYLKKHHLSDEKSLNFNIETEILNSLVNTKNWHQKLSKK
jgi:hypothetical protein